LLYQCNTQKLQAITNIKCVSKNGHKNVVAQSVQVITNNNNTTSKRSQPQTVTVCNKTIVI